MESVNWLRDQTAVNPPVDGYTVPENFQNAQAEEEQQYGLRLLDGIGAGLIGTCTAGTAAVAAYEFSTADESMPLQRLLPEGLDHIPIPGTIGHLVGGLSTILTAVTIITNALAQIQRNRGRRETD